MVEPRWHAHDVSIGSTARRGRSGGVRRLVVSEALDLAQDGGGVDAAAEADDREVGGSRRGAGALLVDAEETDRVGQAQLRQLAGQVVRASRSRRSRSAPAALGGCDGGGGSRGRSASPAARSGSGSRTRSQSGASLAMSRANRSSRRLSKGAGGVAGKIGSPLSTTDGGQSTAQRAGGAQLEAGAPGEVRQELGQRAAVEQRVPEQRERPGDAPARAAASGASSDGAEQRRAASRAARSGRTPPSTRSSTREARMSTACAIARLVRSIDLGRRGRRIRRAHRTARPADRRKAAPQRLAGQAEPGRRPRRRWPPGGLGRGRGAEQLLTEAAGRGATARARAAARALLRRARAARAPGARARRPAA